MKFLPFAFGLTLSLGVSGTAPANDGSPRTPQETPLKATQDTNDCAARRRLTAEQRAEVDMFRAHLSHLERLRLRPNSKGVTYAQKLDEIIRIHGAALTTPETREKAADLLVYENLKQALAKSIGLDNPQFKEFDRAARAVSTFNSAAPRVVTNTTLRLQGAIWKWMHDSVAASGTYGPDARQDVRAVRRLADGETVLGLLDIVYRNLIRDVENNKENLNDEMALYRHLSISVAGGAAVIGSLVASGPIVAGAMTGMATAGGIVAGCGIGALGGAGASVLIKQYPLYANAYIASIERNTSFTCELRSRLNSADSSLIGALAYGLVEGTAAGCVFTGGQALALKIGGRAPRLTAKGIFGAIALATAVEGWQAGKDVYLASRSLKIYRSMVSYENAERAAEESRLEEANQHLHEASEHFRDAGAHALNALIVGIVLRGARGELREALAEGRRHMLALIAKSSDNAAVAALLFKDMALPHNSEANASE